MSQKTLEELLGDIMKDHQGAYDKGASGETPSGAWDGPPLPLNLEYRVEVVQSVFKQSAAGRDQIALTYEILEPEEHAGRKFQEYYAPKATNEVGAQQFAHLLGVYKATVAGWGNNWDGFAAQFEGKTAVIALRLWGDENDRYGCRWVNQDNGQELRTNLQPPKPRGKKAPSTDAEINIPKAPETEATAPVVIPPTPEIAEKAAVAAPAGVNLPPGLRT